MFTSCSSDLPGSDGGEKAFSYVDLRHQAWLRTPFTNLVTTDADVNLDDKQPMVAYSDIEFEFELTTGVQT